MRFLICLFCLSEPCEKGNYGLHLIKLFLDASVYLLHESMILCVLIPPKQLFAW